MIQGARCGPGVFTVYWMGLTFFGSNRGTVPQPLPSTPLKLDTMS